MTRKEKLYDCTFVNTEYLKEEDTRQISLKYYILCDEKNSSYGIEVLKKEKNYLGEENVEISKVENYDNNINYVKNIIIKLGDNKVTPVVLNEVLEDF